MADCGLTYTVGKPLTRAFRRGKKVSATPPDRGMTVAEHVCRRDFQLGARAPKLGGVASGVLDSTNPKSQAAGAKGAGVMAAKAPDRSLAVSQNFLYQTWWFILGHASGTSQGPHSTRSRRQGAAGRMGKWPQSCPPTPMVHGPKRVCQVPGG